MEHHVHSMIPRRSSPILSGGQKYEQLKHHTYIILWCSIRKLRGGVCSVCGFITRRLLLVWIVCSVLWCNVRACITNG